MPQNDRIIGHVTGTLEAIEKRLARIENKVDTLQTDFDQRRGGLRVLYAMASVIGTITGVVGSYIHDLIIKS